MRPAREPAPFLPEPFYWTPDWLAERWGTHRDRVLAMLEDGGIEPAALVLKSALPVELPGLALHVVVPLMGDDLAWEGSASNRAAQLVGEFKVYLPDCKQNRSLALAREDAIFISRSDLVVLDNERERIESETRTPKAINSTERHTLLCIIGQLCQPELAMCNYRPYTLAENLSVDLSDRGVKVRKQAIANKLIEAIELVGLPQQKAAQSLCAGSAPLLDAGGLVPAIRERGSAALGGGERAC